MNFQSHQNLVKKNLSDMALPESSCTMNAVEIKKQKNTPKAEKKQQDMLGENS
jgi:hypothetical protein